MCTLLLWKNSHPRYTLVAAANRDEYYGRPSLPPRVLHSDPLVIGGQDALCGGTWFAVSSSGLFVAVTNRRGAGSHDPAKRSRGTFALELARARSFAEASEALANVDAVEYNPFLIFVGNAQETAVGRGGSDGLHTCELEAGAHAITNWNLDADDPPKAARAKKLARFFDVDKHDEEVEQTTRRLHGLLADHGDESGRDAALCVHKPEIMYGTRSSSIVFLGVEPFQTRFFHAEGPACSSEISDFSALLREESIPHAPKVVER